MTKQLAPFFILLLAVLAGCALAWNAWAWTLTSDPSPQNATHWRVSLSNGTVIEGETVNGSLSWDISGLPVGVYEGNASYGAPEWVLTAEGKTNATGMVWSDPVPFVLERRLDLSSPSNMNLED